MTCGMLNVKRVTTALRRPSVGDVAIVNGATTQTGTVQMSVSDNERRGVRPTVA